MWFVKDKKNLLQMSASDRWTRIQNRKKHLWCDHWVSPPLAHFPTLFQKTGGGDWPNAENYWHASWSAWPTEHPPALPSRRACARHRIESRPAARRCAPATACRGTALCDSDIRPLSRGHLVLFLTAFSPSLTVCVFCVCILAFRSSSVRNGVSMP